MSDDGFDDDFDGFEFYDDLNYQDDDDLSALVDSMAETAFAQGEPIWDEFDAEYDATEYHSDWSYYSDGGFFSDEEQAGEDGKKKPKLGVGSKGELTRAVGGTKKRGEEGGGTGEKMTASKAAGRPVRKRRRLMVVDDSGKEVSESVPALEKVTATVIVPPATTSVKKKPAVEKKINRVEKLDMDKDSSETSPRADAAAIRASMKRKPSTDEATVSP